jgi:pSer/pThr/pTyr-binding forkhead associated (FHA) protein
MKVVLELLDQPSNIRKITVRHDIVIGRGADCNLRLSAPQISRRHCFLRVRGDSVSVTDLDSSNGTYVNGHRIESGKRHEIAHGATVGLGPIRFEVRVRSEKVDADVLKPQILDTQLEAEAPIVPGSRSTMIEMDPQEIEKPDPMNYSVETGGEATDDNEPTADIAQDVIDSEAEIVDLGRRIHELELGLPPAKDGKSGSDQQFGEIKSTDATLKLPDDATLLDDVRRAPDEDGR